MATSASHIVTVPAAPARLVGLAAAAPAHEIAALVTLFAVCATYLAGTGLPDVAQLALAAVAIFTALPHGGADLPVAARLLRPRLGAMWLPVFGVVYLVPAFLMILLWFTAPGWGLTLFLALSVLHFGSTDTVTGGGARAWSVLARGGAPIIVPAVAHPEALQTLFTALAGANGAVLSDLLGGPVAAAWLFAVMLYVVRSVAGSGRTPPRSVEFAAVCGGFALLPPLVAFSIYFGLLHAPRAFIERAREMRLSNIQMFRRSLLASGVAAALLATAFTVLSSATVDFQVGLRTLFVGLAALTVPHMLFDGLRSACRLVPNRWHVAGSCEAHG